MKIKIRERFGSHRESEIEVNKNGLFVDGEKDGYNFEGINVGRFLNVFRGS